MPRHRPSSKEKRLQEQTGNTQSSNRHRSCLITHPSLLVSRSTARSLGEPECTQQQQQQQQQNKQRREQDVPSREHQPSSRSQRQQRPTQQSRLPTTPTTTLHRSPFGATASNRRQSHASSSSSSSHISNSSAAHLLVQLLSAAKRSSGKRRRRRNTEEDDFFEEEQEEDDDDDFAAVFSNDSSSDSDNSSSDIYIEFEEEEEGDDDEDEDTPPRLRRRRHKKKQHQQQQQEEEDYALDLAEVEDPDMDEEDDDDDVDAAGGIEEESSSSSDDDDGEDIFVEARKSRSRSRQRSNSRRSCLANDGEDEEEEDEEGQELVIEAEMDGEHDPRQARRMLTQLTSAAARLARVCPNFAGMRVHLPSLSANSNNSTAPHPPPHHHHDPATSRYLLPPRDLRQFDHDTPTVVVDLDETIIQGRRDPTRPIIRPHIEDLVAALRRSGAEIVIWTAGGSEYADTLLQAVMQHKPRGGQQALGKFWQHLLTREACLQRWMDSDSANNSTTAAAGGGTGTSGGSSSADSSVVLSVKDLSWLGRDVERCLVIENSPVSIVRQPNNGFLVPDFHQANSSDRSLAIAAEIVGAVMNSLRGHPHHHRPADSNANTVPRALERCQQLEACGFRIPGLRSVVTVKTLSYSPHGVARTFGEESS